MIRRTFLAIAVLASLSGCGGRQESKRQAALIPPARNPKIPVEVSYPIISDVDEGPVRRLVDVKLNMKVPPEVLREIALEVKAKEERQHERTVIFYYLPVAFPELAGLPWASTHFKPDLDVEILGLSKREEDSMRSMRLDHKGKRIGAWLQDNQYKTLDLIYDEDGAIKIAEIWSPTARSDSAMIEMPTTTGRRFKKVQGSDIYDVDPDGNLRISNAEGKVFSASKPLRCKRSRPEMDDISVQAGPARPVCYGVNVAHTERRIFTLMEPYCHSGCLRGYPATLFFSSNGLRLINERRSQRLRSCLKGACSKPTNKFVATSAYMTTNSLPDSLSACPLYSMRDHPDQ